MAVQNQRLQRQSRDSVNLADNATASATIPSTSNRTLPRSMPTNKMTNSHTLPTPTVSAHQQTANGGPRVSFNRDVHVKRIGKHPYESTNYETTNLHSPLHSTPYHHLPSDLSAESIRKEAALVLAQAESHKSKAENGDNIPTFKVKTKRSSDPNPKKFHSLPTRKKKGAAKPVERSVSDAAAKKPNKRPSIFNIFSRKSDSSVNQLERDPRFEDSGGRRLVRSKSDVGSSYRKDNLKSKKSIKEPKSPLTGSAKQLPSQLSPIIENAQKEDYFAEQFNRERRKSDAITDREKHESSLNELLARGQGQTEADGTPVISENLLGKNHISNSIKDRILTLQAKSNENMHSSQLPPQKLPLTKGKTVNGLVKRLSMERFSPPPPLSGPAFSYIRPNDGITYAQLDMSDDQQVPTHNNTLQRPERLRSQTRERDPAPLRDYRSPLRDMRSPDRELRRNDFITSQNNLKNSYSTNYNSKDSNRILMDTRDSFSPTVGPTTIRISSSHSPSPWQQLSPRNLSDEDEGLGIETRKYYDDDLHKLSNKSSAEPPIVPLIRSITPPRENGYPTGRTYLSPTRDEHLPDLGNRRARLESRILTRRFGDTDQNGYHQNSSPERNRDVHEESAIVHRYLSPTREPYEPRFHKLNSTEIINKYSPERSHLDIISPTSSTLVNNLPKTEKTSRYKHTKYYDDGRGGVKEVYERETHLDAQGKPHTHESRHRERIGSYTGKRETSPIDRQVFTSGEYEPKSLDSQYTDQYRSSPEHVKRYERTAERGIGQQYQHQDHWQSSLKRDKLQQRSFDKGDSGIENDFRKESFNGDITTRWRKRTIFDDMKACEAFLKKERRHTEQQYSASKNNYVYRERSIDDGSHFDPHLDKYPVATNTLRRRDQQSQTGQGQDTLKRSGKKLGGFEKVKQLFTGGSSHSNSNTLKKETERHARANSSTTSSSAHTTSKDRDRDSERSREKDKNRDKDKENSQMSRGDKDKYMVREDEMRSRYREHRGSLQNDMLREPKITDISMRRRLSTPKASPLLLKRTSSDKTAKKESPLAKPEKTSWFKSLDRRAKSKSKEKLNVSVNGQSETSSMKRSKQARNASMPPAPAKNLRFFGDTDLDSNPPTISKATTTLKTRPTLSSTLNRSQKYSQSAYNLDRINGNHYPNHHKPSHDYRHTLSNQSAVSSGSRLKSSSMHNLENGGTDEVDFRKRRHFSRSRELDDISESGSETEKQHKLTNGTKSLSRDRLDRTPRYDDKTYRRSNDRDRHSNLTGSTMNGGGEPSRRLNHLMGPPKPARSAERRLFSSRERDRFPAESSGTEGESSLHSQRSIVYLHATTVGAIPQPYQLRRRSISRDDLRSKNKNQPLQPMTRTVSRSVSMLAPWKPKLISEGYEINYSQEQNKRMSTMPRKMHANGNASTLTRSGKKSDTPVSSRMRREHLKDDQSSLRNSSTTSASKSALSSNLHTRKIK